MSRAVTADHVLFDECISAFRREQGYRASSFEGESCSYVMTAFELSQQWDLGICTLHPSTKVILQGAYSAFISRVDNPEWVGTHNSHLFGIALSAIISFATGKTCKSTRDDYLCRRDQLSEHDIHQLALINPILTAGPGCTHTLLSEERQTVLGDEIRQLIERLHAVDYQVYRTVIQSIRLVHLSLANKRDDFGLAYLLVVSAIESVAQKSIKRDKVKEKHPSEKVWKEKAKNDEDFLELLRVYMEYRGKQEYLKERYIEFILKYASPEHWEECVQHPMQELAEYVKEISPSHGIDHIVQKHWFEKYPNEFEEGEIRAILADSYTHRSCFIHRGEQPPHTDPSPSLNRFFQEYREYDGYNITEKVLPNYELLLGISKYSILGWINTK